MDSTAGNRRSMAREGVGQGGELLQAAANPPVKAIAHQQLHHRDDKHRPLGARAGDDAVPLELQRHACRQKGHGDDRPHKAHSSQ